MHGGLWLQEMFSGWIWVPGTWVLTYGRSVEPHRRVHMCRGSLASSWEGWDGQLHGGLGPGTQRLSPGQALCPGPCTHTLCPRLGHAAACHVSSSKTDEGERDTVTGT